MVEEFSDRDLSDAVFWGVNLRRSKFRDTDFSGATFFHTGWKDVTIDGEIDALVVNGVDVTGFVNSRDRWYPLRNELSPPTKDGLRSSWAVLEKEWAHLLAKIATSEESVVNIAVNGEWSLRDTLRHLLFAMDKWFTNPLLGEKNFVSIGLPNTGSQNFDWPGINQNSSPEFDEVLHARHQQHAKFTQFLADLDLESLPASVEVLENGMVPVLMCFHVVLEEEFEHLRYTIRDLSTLGIS